MRRPRLTDKVKRGLWMIVSRSATVWSAEQTAQGWDRQEHAAVLAAARYAEAYWRSVTPRHGEEEEDE